MNWRTIGDTTFAAWDALLPANSQIKKRGESRACYEAARPHSKLCLGMLKGESSFATDFAAVPAWMNNPLNLKGGVAFITFDSIELCIKHWKNRITSPTYKSGVYANTVTVRDLVSVYAPGYDNNNVPAYTATIENVVNSLPDVRKEPTVGLTPFPPFDDRPLPDKFGAGMTYQYRKPFVATWWHSMVGWLMSTDGYFRQPNVHAATDWGIGGSGDGDNDGKIIRWIDYQRRVNATPWASGWDVAPHYNDQGAEFVNTFGTRGINPGGISIEFSGLVATPMSVKQWASGIHLTAAVHHNDLGQGYEEFAWNMHHREVAEKDCPFPRIYNYTTEYQTGIKLIMEHHETGRDVPEFVTIAGLQVPLALGGGVVTEPPAPLYIPFANGKYHVFHTVEGARARQYGSLDAKIVRTFKDNVALRCSGYYVGQEVDGDPRWLLIKSTGPSNAARIHASVVKEEFNEAGILR